MSWRRLIGLASFDTHLINLSAAAEALLSYDRVLTRPRPMLVSKVELCAIPCAAAEVDHSLVLPL